MTSRIYDAPKCEYTIEDGCIRTDGSIKGKVTGTMMAGILGVSPWSTPFQVACGLLGVGVEDISNKPAVRTGQILESKIIDYVAKAYPEHGLFMPAESIYEKREGDHASWASDFEDDTFAGHVDGIVMKDDGTNYILEVKTSGNLKSWEDGVPIYYQLQVGLYNHFISKQDKAYVVLGTVGPETYKDPEGWVPDDSNTFMFEMPIDQLEFNEHLREVASWYDRYIGQGVTPPYDPTNPGDVELFQHLVNLTQDGDEISDLIDEYFRLDTEEKEHDDIIKDKRKLKEGLKVRIKDWFDCHGAKSMDSRSGECYAAVTERISSKIDPELLRADGLDPDRYTVTTISKTFTVKKKK